MGSVSLYPRMNALVFLGLMVRIVIILLLPVMQLHLMVGAGKTTMFSILTGDIAPTSGTAIIAGFDVRTDLRKVNILCMSTVGINWALTCTSGPAMDRLLSSVWCSDREDDGQRTADHVCQTERHSRVPHQSGSGGWGGQTGPFQTCQQTVWQVQVYCTALSYWRLTRWH